MFPNPTHPEEDGLASLALPVARGPPLGSAPGFGPAPA